MSTPSIIIGAFGEHLGQPVHTYTLNNGRGLEATFTNYGATILSLLTPDREGRVGDVVLGFNTLDDYRAEGSFQGALIGRVGNRISGPCFTIDGRTYDLPHNDSDGPNCLHGGPDAFDKKVWQAAAAIDGDEPLLTLSYRSPDGEMGFPGNLEVTVTYRLTAENAWQIDYQATTDETTVFNPTQHAYFNLAGEGSGDILGHQLTLHCDAFTPRNNQGVPNGEIAPVHGTPLDFTTAEPIGARLDVVDAQLGLAGQTYDHNYVVRGEPGHLRPAADVVEPAGGRAMAVETTEPGVQLYIAGNLANDGPVIGKRGVPYERHHAFCLETQHFPDAPNRPEFPPIILRPGQTFRSTTRYRFFTV